uniref:Uncharacterized protein n=1 Tax=Leptobrachium leishanense TaxID=445787 RepID=A0A8C5MGW7_9ANUR
MVKLCAHHQEQFAQVLNSLCTEDQFTLSEKNTPISDDQRNGCTCFEAKAKALPLLDSRASTATPQDPVVITKAEANSANEIEHHVQLVDCSPGLFPRSPIPVETSAEDCMTPKNYSVVSKIVYSKEDGKQSIKSEDSSLRLEDCSAVSHEKGININAKGLAPCADALRDQEHLLDPLDGGIIDLYGGSSPSIDASKAIDRLKESVASTILPFQDQENGLVSAAQKTLLQETRPCLTSTAPFVVNCDEPSGAFTIGRPIHEYRTDVPFPKCESVSKASVEVVSIAQLEETDLERKPSKRSLESCTEYIAHTIINGTSTHCPLSYAVINTANGHNEMVITPSNVLDVENKDVFSSEVQVQEDGTADPAVNARFGVDLVSCKTEPVSPSLDVDLNLFVETKSTIDVCETATTEFHCEQNPLRIPSEKPLVLVDSSVRLPTPVFLQTNGIDEQIVHCPICQSNLKKSDTQVHSETCIVVQNLKTEDVEMTISSLGDINTNDYPGGNSSELSKPKCTQALKPLHSKLNCNATHSVNRATSDEILVNLRSRSCIEGFHTEMPTENNLHSCPLETDIKCVLVKPGSLAPQQEMLKCTKQFDNSEGNCVISSIKENLNIEAGLERSAEIGKNAPSNQTEKLNRSTLASLDHELVENLPVACIKVEENITFINQGFDCSEYKIIPNIQMYARTKPLSKKFSALIPSDRCLRSHVFNEPPILIPQTQAPKCIGNKIVNAVTYGETADSLSACEDNKNVLRIRKAVGNTKSASDENDTHQSSNSMRTKNKPVVSKALFIKQEDDEPLDKTVCQERKYYLSLRNRDCVPDVLSKDICHNASILESSTFNQEAQNKYFSRQSLITKKHTHSKPANKPKRLDSENYNLRTSIAHAKPKRVTKTANCINIASIKSEETFSGLELSSPANETRRPKFVDCCSEEDNQELISSFSSKYMSVHKTWIPLEKEGTVTHKAKNRADKLKEIWKTKKRTRKNRSGLEAPKYSPIQSLFMTSVHFSDICQWFVETTETKSLVIVKKLNTRLPGDLELPSFPLHKYPASSLYPHMLQAQRLKKYLKKFASVTPACNDQKLQTTLTKLKEGGDLNLHENLSDNDIVQGTNACRAGKSKGNVSKPVTDQILPKYNNCKGVSHLISALVKPEKKEHPINAMETKISCSNTSTRMSFSRSASEVGNDFFPLLAVLGFFSCSLRNEMAKKDGSPNDDSRDASHQHSIICGAT